ncbi:hypothetical protein [Paenibacillus sp. JJ-223]|uniref:hypothetical protein n=1 Tax=Paenibacillus sp. JJ-223 TaxID=2905647 RepID=UPI001F3BF26A|nr:hypothetical protein [Paenibacillus sp. JJ-223]CAH1192415.1 hypothetical protein PAECIP111890_00739 [Paenibacillus sp. JJ-223]
MKTKLSYTALAIAIILIITSLIFFNKYNSLMNRIESATNLSFKLFITETQNYQDEINDYIETNKNSAQEALIKDANSMRKAYQNYALLVSLANDDADTKLYNQRTDLYLKIINSEPDFNNASVNTLKDFVETIDATIKELQRVK